ncbi:biliverdin-producing heme oxygenase [Mucilaginibacter robiniae]|uniref:Biliverdin-producing heme oxygenase n=1 Tax=Mucilaginibacter robiniae TaxID=2728022 RepID=A0A7L5E1C5_9SPHI|nr:biliverdin-producing heme oxygenase [Mucilaginibacter robiniae]QJD96187.1 biliverdin-producing heme oxygenase [Mucilaginibacter robiniae]
MLAEQLKKDTLQNHQQLEKMLVGRMKAIRSATDYVNLLQLFYSYFGGLETQIAPFINQSNLADYADRRKSEALANDIKALGGQPHEKASGTHLPAITNTAEAFAALYVIEGSTLGGKIISKMMAQQLNITDGRGLTFFSGYGDATESMWTGFKTALNAQAGTPSQQADIINTANETFAKFKQWVEKNN